MALRKPAKKLTPGRYLPPVMGAPKGIYGGAKYGSKALAPKRPALPRGVPLDRPGGRVGPGTQPGVGYRGVMPSTSPYQAIVNNWAPTPVTATTPPTAPAPATPAPPAAAPNVGSLSQNPQLPSIPSGAYTDAQFVQDEGALRAEIMSQYNDVLRQLGYESGGQHIQGDVEIAAGQQTRELERQRSLAEMNVTNQMQGAGTLFSGYRGEEQARQTQPMTQGLADIQLQLPRDLGGLYQQATGLLSNYEIQRNQYLLDALRRRQATNMEEM